MSPVHQLPAQTKIVSLVCFALLVVMTPAAGWPLLLLDAVLLVAVAVVAGLRPAAVLRGMRVELPFVVFALVLPLVALGERVEVLGLQLSRPGLLAAGMLLARATLGVLAAVILAATTGGVAVVAGLERLRLPPPMVAIIGFMVRYLDVVQHDLHRIRIARESRGGGGRARTLAAVAAGAGALFVRSYERGERVHQAMTSRGFDGRMPPVAVAAPASTGQWAAALALPGAAALALAGWRVLG